MLDSFDFAATAACRNFLRFFLQNFIYTLGVDRRGTRTTLHPSQSIAILSRFACVNWKIDAEADPLNPFDEFDLFVVIPLRYV